MKFINALVVKLVDKKDLKDFPILYKKHYFSTERYLNIVKREYKDCNLNIKLLKKGLKN